MAKKQSGGTTVALQAGVKNERDGSLLTIQLVWL